MRFENWETRGTRYMPHRFNIKLFEDIENIAKYNIANFLKKCKTLQSHVSQLFLKSLRYFFRKYSLKKNLCPQSIQTRTTTATEAKKNHGMGTILGGGAILLLLNGYYKHSVTMLL